MQTDSDSYKLLKNLSYSFLGFLVPIVFSIVVTPVFVRHLGLADYGVFTLANTITGFLGLLDLGLTTALIKYLAQYYSVKDYKSLVEVSASANLLYCGVGTIGFFAFFLLGRFFLPAFQIKGVSESHVLIIFLVAGLTFLVNALNSVFTSIPVALQRYDIVTKINLAQLAFFSLGSLVAVLLGFQLKAVMLVNLASSVGLTVGYVYYSRKILPEVSWRLGWVKEQVTKLFSFGVFAAITNITNGSLNQIDRLLIPIFLGPVQLSFYSLPGNVAQKSATVAGNLSGVFFPFASSAAAVGRESLGEVYRRSLRNLAILAASIATSIMIFGREILTFWLNKQVAQEGYHILLILSVTYFILAIYGTLYNFLMGLGQEKALSKWSAFFAFLNLILLILLIPKWGITGAAWAFLLAAFSILALFYWAETKVFRLQNIVRYNFILIAKILFTAFILTVFAKLILARFITNFISLALIGPLAVPLYLLLYKIFGFFPKEDADIFASFWQKILEKFGIKK